MRKILCTVLTTLLILQCLLLCSCRNNQSDLYAREIIKYIEEQMENTVECKYSEYTENRNTVNMKFVDVDSIAKIDAIIFHYNKYLKENSSYFMNKNKSVIIEFYFGEGSTGTNRAATCSNTDDQYIDYLDLYCSSKAYSYRLSELDHRFSSIKYVCLGNKYYADKYDIFKTWPKIETVVIDSGRDIDALDLRDEIKEVCPDLQLYC
ncbi:MAG: hypothetical protein MJ153_03590 [Clostridia bacterium]|nr:hypothetical protein [Clostridia bacterium]